MTTPIEELIESVAILDDDAKSRETWEFPVEDGGFKPVPKDGPLPGLRETAWREELAADAALCDHKLTSIGNYADFTGAELVAHLYRQKYPALLCTRWEEANLEEIRSLRRWIPSLLSPNELDPQSLVDSFQSCLREFSGEFSPDRRAWRALVRIEDYPPDGPFFYVVVPSWDPNEVLRLDKRSLGCSSSPPDRVHALVNLGAEAHEQIFLDEWEL